jgi:Uma2 family endonuclease
MATVLPDYPAASFPTAYTTVQDVVAQLPGIAHARIRLLPTPGTATEADIERVRREEGKLCEIYDGVLVEKPTGQPEARLAMLIGGLLLQFADEHGIDCSISGADSLLRLLDRQVRMPDVAVILRTQFADGQYPTEQIWRAYPDLAVEVLSPSNSEREIERKGQEYFAAGSRLMWVVDPASRSVTVFTSPNHSRVLTSNDILDGGDVLPGLKLPLAKIFRD